MYVLLIYIFLEYHCKNKHLYSLIYNYYFFVFPLADAIEDTEKQDENHVNGIKNDKNV